MTESPLLSRQAVREYLGISEAKLREIIIKGDVRPHSLTGSFNRAQVESFAQECAKEILYGNLGQTEATLESVSGHWGKPALSLGTEEPSGNGVQGRARRKAG